MPYEIMSKKIIFHLSLLLLIFVGLNILVKYVIVPEIKFSQEEANKIQQTNIVSVLKELPLLTNYLLSHKTKNANTITDKKLELYAIEQQWKQPFLYFLQKQILAASKSLIKTEPPSYEKTSFSLSNNEEKPHKTQKTDTTEYSIDNNNSYFTELVAHLEENQLTAIIINFQEHLKKLKPILERNHLEMIQFEKDIPESIVEKETYLTNFHYSFNQGKGIYLAFLKATPTLENYSNPSIFKGVHALYTLNINKQLAISLLPQQSPPPIEWQKATEHFYDESGYLQTSINSTTDNFQFWVKNKDRTITILEMYWPKQEVAFNDNVLYDSVLFIFLLLMAVWFYFYHVTQNYEKTTLALPIEIETLKQEKKQLEKLLIDRMEASHTKQTTQTLKPHSTLQTVFTEAPEPTEKNTYIIPKEQSYIDQKVDFKKPQRDTLMEDSKTEWLKILVKKVREK